MEHTPWKLPSGITPWQLAHVPYTIDVTSWNIKTWRLPHGAYTMECTYWILQY